MFTDIKQKRIDQIVVGEIVKGGVIGGWSEVFAVDVDEEYPATKLTWYRLATNGGIVDPNQRGRATKHTQVLASFDLVYVQVAAGV
jgi:hypothetical protein